VDECLVNSIVPTFEKAECATLLSTCLPSYSQCFLRARSVSVKAHVCMALKLLWASLLACGARVICFDCDKQPQDLGDDLVPWALKLGPDGALYASCDVPYEVWVLKNCIRQHFLMVHTARCIFARSCSLKLT